jgi:hypothetical protein
VLSDARWSGVANRTGHNAVESLGDCFALQLDLAKTENFYREHEAGNRRVVEALSGRQTSVGQVGSERGGENSPP